ncbi:unnamed protein product, partial [Mesorhabditis spiculigera]
MNGSLIDIFENPYFDVITIYKIAGPIVFIINLAGIIIVYRKTPPEMQDYSFCLMCHLVIGLLHETVWTMLLCPRMYTPYIMGSAHGLLTNLFHLDIHIQQSIGLFLVQAHTCTVAHLIIFRANSVLPYESPWKLEKAQLNRFFAVMYLLNVMPNFIVQFFVAWGNDGMAEGHAFVLVTRRRTVYPTIACYSTWGCWMAMSIILEIQLPSTGVLNDLACLLFGFHNPFSVFFALILNNVYRESLIGPFRLGIPFLKSRLFGITSDLPTHIPMAILNNSQGSDISQDGGQPPVEIRQPRSLLAILLSFVRR